MNFNKLFVNKYFKTDNEGVPFEHFESFQIVRSSDVENNMFKDDFIFSCICLTILLIIRRVAGPDFDEISEVPEII